MPNHLHQLAIALDQLVNTLLGGYADETLSARCYRLSDRYWYAKVCRFVLDLVLSPRRRDHCLVSYQNEVARRQLPPDYQRV